MKKIKETIEITEEFTVPGTKVIVEKGDKITAIIRDGKIKAKVE